MLAEDGFAFLDVKEVDIEALRAFDCGKARLNSFLIEESQSHHHDLLGFTRVLFHREIGFPIAYFTLCNDAIPLNTSEQQELGLAYHIDLRAFPAVKIGRLAVHRELHGQGIGAFLMKHIAAAIMVAPSAGRLLVVDADNEPDVLKFYGRSGFVKSLWAENQAKNHSSARFPAASVKMHKDVATL